MNYVCLWLQMKQNGKPLPDEFWPAKCKAVVDTAVNKFGECFLVWLDDSYPGIEKTENVKKLIDMLISVKINSVIVCWKYRRRVVYISPDGDKVLREMGINNAHVHDVAAEWSPK